MTTQQVVDRIKSHVDSGGDNLPADLFNPGHPDTVITGITTSYTPSITVLKKSVESNKNLIITQQPAFYQEADSHFNNDPGFLYKKEFIEDNRLVIWPYNGNWNSRQADGQLFALARALGWEKYHLADPDTGSTSFVKQNHFFKLPEGTLREKIEEIKGRLNIYAFRVIGKPNTIIRKASITNGMFRLVELQEILKLEDIDLIVIPEAIEWESCEYFRDYLIWKGDHKAMILLGREVSEDPGYQYLASWLKTVIPELPVEWISAKEPFWVP